MIISSEDLSLAGEYAVASELCRRGDYAQLTLGHRKKTDLLVETKAAKLLRIQVKTKQGEAWPLIKGICGNNIILVFVDYENKNLDQRPDFYILNPADWKNFVKHGWVGASISKGEYKLDDQNCPIHIDKSGEANWRGVNIEADEITKHREKWRKIESIVKAM